jgi:NADH-quinone oxidoreductase subunit C/D
MQSSAQHPAVVKELFTRFGETSFTLQQTADGIPTLWVAGDRVIETLRYLKTDVARPYRMLYDLTAIDERVRRRREGQPDSDFTLVYHLLSFDRNEDVRLKVPLKGGKPSAPTATGVWESANWYEREVFDMFGVEFSGHPHLQRILMPRSWKGHPLRKDHPARATEMGVFELPQDKQDEEQSLLRFNPDEYGMERHRDGSDYMFLNIGPQHPGTHGIIRIILQLLGEEIVDAVVDIGYHHRGAEKMSERQSWHTFIPYTDRVDYLGGVMNNLAYLLAVEKLAGITVPERAQVIRVMLAEFFRIANHLLWLGTFGQDLGQMSPVFYTFTERERVFDIVSAICGDRMHPNWFRIGGVAQDLPNGWDRLVREFVSIFPKRLKEFNSIIMKNRIIKARSVGIGCYTRDEAIEWGVTGPGLRACGMEWDFRKKRPYSGYDRFDFDIPVGRNGDCYDRSVVRLEEMAQSIRIIGQCLENMPPGDYKSDHPLATPPRKERTMEDIETLITHFLSVTWGPVIPAGECFHMIEAIRGSNGYYIISDNDVSAYRTRIRTPSFPHVQMIPYISRGHAVADLLAIVASVDYVLADIDR